MKMEYTAEILRGWPADGARERTEIVSQGVTLVNGDVVTMQADGTVNKVGATKSKRVGLVIRGNGDSASNANANGRFMTPQPVASITATWTGGYLVVTHTAHGFATGNQVTIAASAGSTTFVNYVGTWLISVVDANTYRILVANNGTITTGTAQRTGVSTSGKATVLWGNYIARISNFDGTPTYAPGSPLTAQNGKFTLAVGQGNANGTYTVTATNTIDPEVGYVLSVQGATTTDTANLVIVAF